MFTMKKLALIGAAGLAALSMSCSDDKESGSGSFSGFDIQDKPTGIFLSGTITADDGVNVSKVTMTANASAVELDGLPTLPAAKVELKDVTVSGVCAGKSGVQSGVSFEITATFDDETTTSEKKTIDVDCGGPSGAAGTFVLSNAGASYIDLDSGDEPYKQAVANTKKSETDLVAYASASAENKIYTGNVIFGADGGAQAIWELAGGTEDAAELLDQAFDATEEDEDGGDDISIVKNKTFLVETDEAAWFAVKITDADTSGKSVTIKVISLD